jgi:hypothetical protein
MSELMEEVSQSQRFARYGIFLYRENAGKLHSTNRGGGRVKAFAQSPWASEDVNDRNYLEVSCHWSRV